MCDADTSRSFSNVYVLVYATETAAGIGKGTHDEGGAALAFGLFSSSSPRVAVYLIHFASDSTGIVTLDHAAQCSAGPLDDFRCTC